MKAGFLLGLGSSIREERGELGLGLGFGREVTFYRGRISRVFGSVNLGEDEGGGEGREREKEVGFWIGAREKALRSLSGVWRERADLWFMCCEQAVICEDRG